MIWSSRLSSTYISYIVKRLAIINILITYQINLQGGGGGGGVQITVSK